MRPAKVGHNNSQQFTFGDWPNLEYPNLEYLWKNGQLNKNSVCVHTHACVCYIFARKAKLVW